MKQFSEIELASPELDCDAPSSPGVPYIIASTKRSGSFLLCSILTNLGVGIPSEYLNRVSISRIGSRIGMSEIEIARNPSLYIEKLRSIRTKNGSFGLKAQYWELIPALRQCGELSLLLKHANWVFLSRENLREQAKSLIKAHSTGKWSLTNDITTPPNPNIWESAQEIEHMSMALADDEKKWRVFFALNGIEPLNVKYESLVQFPSATIMSVYNWVRHGLPDRRPSGIGMVAKSHNLPKVLPKLYRPDMVKAP